MNFFFAFICFTILKLRHVTIFSNIKPLIKLTKGFRKDSHKVHFLSKKEKKTLNKQFIRNLIDKKQYVEQYHVS